MATAAFDSETPSRPRRRLWGRLVYLWLLLAAALCFWQVVAYRSLVERIADWQFGLFGTYFPSLTYLVMLLIAGIPIGIYFVLRWREARRASPIESGGGRAIATATRWMRAFFGLAALAGVAAVAVLITTPGDNSEAAAVQQVDTSRITLTDIVEGKSELTGNTDYSHIAGFGQDLFVTQYNTFFAPVSYRTEGGIGPRFFVELKRIPGDAPRFVSPGVGVLRKNALPGEIAALYRSTGMKVAEPHYVLFQSDQFQRWRHFVLAGQLALTTVIFALFGFWQRRRAKRLRSDGRSTPQG
jgi:hypothetical protein